MKFFAIDTYMIPSKLAFLLYGLHIGSYMAFMNVFLISVGLSKFQAGSITGLIYVLPIFAGPLWGYISDRTGRKRLVLFLMCLGSSVFMFPLPWVAHSIYPMASDKCNATVKSNGSNWMYTSSVLTNSIGVDCVNTKDAIHTLYLVLLILVLCASSFLIPLPPYVDTLVINVVKSAKNGATYGGQRILASFGTSLGSFLAGRTADSYVTNMSPYTAVFFYFLPVTLLLFPAGCYLIKQFEESDGAENEDQKDKNDLPNKEIVGDSPAESQFQQVIRLFRRFEVMFFMCTVLVSGIGNNIFYNFTYVLVTDELKRSKTEMTYVIIVATISEAAFFPFTSKVMEMLGGPIQASIVGTLSFSVRFFVMSCDVPFWVIIAIQIFSALSFALSWTAFMEQVYIFAPKSINVTMNSIMMAIYAGLGNTVANILGAKVYEIFDGQSLFLGHAIICLAWSVVMVAYYGMKRLKLIRQRKMEKEVGTCTVYENDLAREGVI